MPSECRSVIANAHSNVITGDVTLFGAATHRRLDRLKQYFLSHGIKVEIAHGVALAGSPEIDDDTAAAIAETSQTAEGALKVPVCDRRSDKGAGRCHGN